MRVFCVKIAGPALLFVAGMGEKLYLCRFESFGEKKMKNGFMKMSLSDDSLDDSLDSNI